MKAIGSWDEKAIETKAKELLENNSEIVVKVELAVLYAFSVVLIPL